jgi:hypothetical protein
MVRRILCGLLAICRDLCAVSGPLARPIFPDEAMTFIEQGEVAALRLDAVD